MSAKILDQDGIATILQMFQPGVSLHQVYTTVAQCA